MILLEILRNFYVKLFFFLFAKIEEEKSFFKYEFEKKLNYALRKKRLHEFSFLFFIYAYCNYTPPVHDSR